MTNKCTKFVVVYSIASLCRPLTKDYCRYFDIYWQKTVFMVVLKKWSAVRKTVLREEKNRPTDEHNVAAKKAKMNKKKQDRYEQINHQLLSFLPPFNANQSFTTNSIGKSNNRTNLCLFSLRYTAHLVEFNKPHASKPLHPAVGLQRV